MILACLQVYEKLAGTSRCFKCRKAAEELALFGADQIHKPLHWAGRAVVTALKPAGYT